MYYFYNITIILVPNIFGEKKMSFALDRGSQYLFSYIFISTHPQWLLCAK